MDIAEDRPSSIYSSIFVDVTKLSQIGSIEEARHTIKHGTFVGVCDPTGSIPSGQIFLTGLGDLTPPKVLITRVSKYHFFAFGALRISSEVSPLLCCIAAPVHKR